ncbi:MlaA family lipoprotein [Novosphingobium umbonatum]|nr:VacJ family lipoprotein [Novosphingobium umbonatum]
MVMTSSLLWSQVATVALASGAPVAADVTVDGPGQTPTAIAAQPVEAASDPAEAQPATQSVVPAPADAAPVDNPAPDASAVVLRDPWEKLNRDIWKFDLFFEKTMLGPVAHGYSAVVPSKGREGLSNLIRNLDEPSTFANQLLQHKIGRAVQTGLRFALNSTLGIAGLFDVAAAAGMRRATADFGQTLAFYGAKPGPYAMLPFLGPSNVRDGFGRLVDTLTDPVGFVIGGVFTSYPGAGRLAAEGVNWRQQSEGTIQAIYGASDPYAFTRAAYSQQRAAIVQDATGKAAALPDF